MEEIKYQINDADDIVKEYGLHKTLIKELSEVFIKNIGKRIEGRLEFEKKLFEQEYTNSITPQDILKKELQKYTPTETLYIYSSFYINKDIDENKLLLFLKNNFNVYPDYLLQHLQDYLTGTYDKVTCVFRFGYFSHMEGLYFNLKMLSYIKQFLPKDFIRTLKNELNPHTDIFISFKSFKIFIDYITPLKDKNEVELNFIYQIMKDKDLLVPEITFKQYQKWVYNTKTIFPNVYNFRQKPVPIKNHLQNLNNTAIQRIERFNLLYEKYYK